jgi:hypothetical protein
MMERAVWSSLTEPLVAGLVTGDMQAAWKNMGYVFGHLRPNADARDRTALAEFLNVISSAQHDSVMLSRQGVDVNDQPAMGRLLTAFYRATFLTQVTNGQRAGTVASTNRFISLLAQHVLDPGGPTTGTDVVKAAHGRQDAARWLRELGLPNEIHKDFSQFMVDLKGAMPTPDLLNNHRFGDAYSLATRRLIDRIIQDPYKVDRAMLSGAPILGAAFQLMAFNYSAQKNVLNPAGERLVHNFTRGRGEAMGLLPPPSAPGVPPGPRGTAGQFKGALAGLAAHPGALAAVAGSAFSMFMASLLLTTVRQYIYAPDQWDKHTKDDDLGEYLKDLAFSRSGLNGVLDPVLQIFNHLKYESDLSALMHGASVNTYLSNLFKVAQPLLGKTDSNTNTSLYNAAQGMFNLVGVPLTAYGLTALSTVAGPIGKVATGIALQTLTSPAASNRIATMLAGRKGTELPKPETGGAGLPDMPGMGGLPNMPGMDGGGAVDKKAKPGGFAAAYGPVLGLIDDVAVPAFRYIGPMLGALSTPVKIGAAAAGGAYGAYKYLEKTAPFRNQPAPEK